MKLIHRLAAAANRLLLTGAALLAALLFLYGLYVLYDIRYTGQNAFVSYDLLQYRPKITPKTEDPEEDGGENELDALIQINPDTVGWLEIFGTHINYPVVQGDNDLEYLNKDIYGNTTVTGSIYLASDNDRSFGDWYNVIYGHHMDNGAMFGDIDRYLDADYFASHSKGILQTPDGDWEITVFACVSTDSYEGTVYRVSKDADEAYPPLRDYIRRHSYQQSEIPPEMGGEEEMLLGFSTCTDAATNGRIVLFARADPLTPARAEELRQETEKKEEQPSEPKKTVLTAIGHLIDAEHWSLLNLVCVLLTLGTFLPVTALRRKFRQLPYARRTADFIENRNGDAQTVRSLRRFVRRMRAGILCEGLLFLFSVLAFLATENLSKHMTLRDEYTGAMIAVTAAALLVDFICFRYRGKRPETEALTSTAADG